MSQKSILITGCSSGIGYDAAHGLADRGWRVFASCRQARDAERLRGEGLESLVLDYEDEASIEAALAEVLGHTGGTLDAVFNNGAYAVPGATEDIPTDAMRAIFEANFFGWHTLTRAVIPVMRAQGSGRIVMNSSILGFIAAPWRAPYVATKYAVEGWADTLRIEMRGTGIHISLIEPGPISTNIRQNARIQFEKWVDWEGSVRAEQYRRGLIKRLNAPRSKDRFELPASAVTKKLIHALESPRPRPRYYVTTPTYLMGGLRRVLSTRALDWLLARG